MNAREGKFRKLALQRVGGVVCTEDLCGEVVHELLEVFVQNGWLNLVKDLVLGLLPSHELCEIFVDRLVNLHSVQVTDGILAKEIEVHGVRGIQLQVLATKRTAADCISLLLGILLSSDTECESVNEVRRSGLLAFLLVR